MITVRCVERGCRAKTTAEVTETQRAKYADAIRAGAERGLWDKYWAVQREINARCWLHEDVPA